MSKRKLGAWSFLVEGAPVTTRYARELDTLEQVYSTAQSVNIDELTGVVEAQFDASLIAIGSGGSFSTASFASQLHERMTGRLSRASTPLAYLESPVPDAAVLCLSASGRNRDIGAAFKAAAVAEQGSVSALVMADETPLHALAAKYPVAEVASVRGPSFRDGFLAVATLLAAAVVLARAYSTVASTDIGLPSCLQDLEGETLGALKYKSIPTLAADVMAKPTVSVLFSPLLSATTVDLESRFVEAALGGLHIADFRNFGHGRHHWIAKRGLETGVVALVDGSGTRLADRTLSLLPDTIEKCRIDLYGHEICQMISGLIVGLYLSLAAGRAAGIDPGKPGVPLFGRKLYALGPGATKDSPAVVNRRVAIHRKRGRARLAARMDNASWIAAYEQAVERLSKAELGGIVFDYDGTLCRDKDRFKSLPPNVASAIERLVGLGLCVGIATGRGPSAGKAMRASLDREFWDDIVVGYYNGGVIVRLSDDRDPIAEGPPPQALLDRLRNEPGFSSAEIRANNVQITIRLSDELPAEEAINHARRVIRATEEQARVLASSHSIDIVLGTASKGDVVEVVSGIAQNRACLRIGDQGRWPGNDADLLDHPLGLSVNTVSRHLQHCWNLAPAGVRGVDAALFYMDCLSAKGKSVRFVLRTVQRGVGNAS